MKIAGSTNSDFLFDYIPTPSEIRETKEDFLETKIEDDHDEIKARLLKAFTDYVVHNRNSSRITVGLEDLFSGADAATEIVRDMLPEDYNIATEVNRVLTITWGGDVFTPFGEEKEESTSSLPSHLSVNRGDLRDNTVEFTEGDLEAPDSIVFSKPKSYESHDDNLPENFLDRFLILRTGSVTHKDVAQKAMIKLWDNPPEDLVGTYSYFMETTNSDPIDPLALQTSISDHAVVFTAAPDGRLQSLVDDYDYSDEFEIVVLHEDYA